MTRVHAWPAALRGSLLLRLLALVGAGVLLAWLLAVATSAWQARHELDELLDRQLSELVCRALPLFDGAQAGSSRCDDDEHHDAVALSLYDLDGRLLASTRQPPLPFQPAGSAAPEHVSLDGEAWEIRVAQNAHRQLVAGQPRDTQNYVAAEIVDVMHRPLLAAIAVLLPLAGWGLWRGLAPLRRLAAELRTRSPERLDPLRLDDLPSELAPAQLTLNRLFAQLSATLERERRFTADAAHELRTPLAALKLQIELLRGSPRADVRERATARALAGLARAERLVGQLLELARLDRMAAGAGVCQPLDALVHAALAEAALVAAPAVEAAGAEVCRAQPALLGVLLRNLVDNAHRYGATSVTVRVAGRCLAVEDDGPGAPPEVLARLGERFYRPAGQAAPGAGLGLSIVRRIAELHGATLALANRPEGGLRVEVVFPPPAAVDAQTVRR
ncbi:two-component system sensor histidine kinase QseC [Plasticicumulans lactativorans]|uniref:histidine kinase n=1 Tax=Plasticicumulans lactativorans TaxID=1133106 RepID=A0A4R2LFK4_9GAMM|nr:ATP-binding protein [Plasticicumulans lactativorans]TCO83474.1 two-component system sensor histidine kinase QseC [Plasticicumulans lactativorans]